MKRSEINTAYRRARDCFARHHWALPPHPRWDITDFGLGEFRRHGLVLVNLAEEPEYCEKLMFACRDQVTPAHTHARKKEDIICRAGELAVQVWPAIPEGERRPTEGMVTLWVNREMRVVPAGETLRLTAGERVTLRPGVWHAFWPRSEECIIGEVSTANDDAQDNFFADHRVGRFSAIEEDAPVEVRLLNE
jgi:D-lyxose ketol-isomerase